MYKKELYKNIVVIGGNVAGLAAASQAKRVYPEAKVTVLEAGPYISYGSCGLPYYVTGEIKDFDQIFVYTPQFFEQKRDIRILLEHKVTTLDTAQKQVMVNQKQAIGYDRLIICTGASPASIDLPGSNSGNVFSFWNVTDTVNVKTFIQQNQPRKALIVGAGSIGLLMAETFHSLGIGVTIIEMADRILGEYEPEITDIMSQLLDQNHIQVFLSSRLTSFKGKGGAGAVEAAVLQDQQMVNLPMDMALVSVGVKPNTSFLENTSVELGPAKAIKVNSKLQSSHLNIFAAGDCATVKNIVTGKDDYIPTANNAAKTGRIAGANAAGADSSFNGSVNTKIDKIFGIEIAKTGIGLQEALSLGYDAVKVTGIYPSHVKALPGAEPITIALIVDRGGRRVLGAQMAGKKEVSKRIDVFATAITAEMTADEVYMLDLSYAPKVSTVWDPVNKICAKAVLTLDRS